MHVLTLDPRRGCYDRFVVDIMGDVRQADLEEWFMGTGLMTHKLLLEGRTGAGDLTRALVNEHGKCLCMWGVFPDEDRSNVGRLWLIATNEAANRGKAIHKLWRRELKVLHAKYPKLEAWSYHKNTLHHKWLRVIGFELMGSGKRWPFLQEFHLFMRYSAEGTDV